MAIPEKYSHISFVPPAGVRREAARGLAMRREHGRGGTAIGIARARDLSNGTELSPSTLRRMKAFFDRHAPDRKAKGFRAGEEGFPSNGKIADLLWGGRSGESWANKVVRQMNAADERTYSPEADTATLEEEAVPQRSTAMQGVERRYYGSFEKADSNSLTVEHRADPETGKRRTYIVGYAAKFGTDSLLLGDFIERLAPTAFDIVKAGKDKSGKPLSTRCLFNHDPNHLLGRFPTTMKLIVDKIGLRYECLLPESRQDIAESIARGDLKGSSFSFVIDEDGGEKWTTENGQSIRLVKKIKSLLDVSPVTYPAYDDATVAIAKRSYETYAKTSKTIVVPKVNFDAEIKKLREFVAEHRGFCPTGPGGGVDNTCGEKSGGESDNKKLAKEALDKYEAGRKTTSGKILDNAAKGAGIGGIIGAAGGAVGIAAGAAAGAAVGAAVGAAKAVFSKGDKKLDSAMKSVGVTPQHVDAAAKSLGMEMKVEGSGGNVIAAGGSTSMMISKDEGGVSVHFMSNGDPTESGMIDDTQGGALSKKIEDGSYTPKDGDRMLGKLADSFTKAAKAAGASSVSAGLYDKESVIAFEKKGFRVTEKAKDKYSPTVVVKELSKNSARRSYDDLLSFFHSRAFCATGEGGGIDNTCNGGFAGGGSKKELPNGFAGKKSDVVSKYGSDSPSKTKGESGKYKEWKKGDHLDKVKEKDAQDFLDNAREEQLSKGGKDKGQSDDGGGVQTWSKGDHFPWTVKQVGDVDGHVQGQHPDGSKTEKYPFKGGKTSDAFKKVSDEIKRRKDSRADQVIADTLKFLKDRRA